MTASRLYERLYEKASPAALTECFALGIAALRHCGIAALWAFCLRRYSSVSSKKHRIFGQTRCMAKMNLNETEHVHLCKGSALQPVADRLPIGPAAAVQSCAQVIKRELRNRDWRRFYTVITHDFGYCRLIMSTTPRSATPAAAILPQPNGSPSSRADNPSAMTGAT